MKKHPLYRTWIGIKTRCYNKKDKDYHNYGGRGIKMCERWLKSFENFAADMGEKPTPTHTIDRYPNKDGDYEPTNCRWATPLEQSRNRNSRKLSKEKANEIRQRFMNGERNRALAKEYGVCSAMVSHIVKNRNWTN